MISFITILTIVFVVAPILRLIIGMQEEKNKFQKPKKKIFI